MDEASKVVVAGFPESNVVPQPLRSASGVGGGGTVGVEPVMGKL